MASSGTPEGAEKHPQNENGQKAVDEISQQKEAAITKEQGTDHDKTVGDWSDSGWRPKGANMEAWAEMHLNASLALEHELDCQRRIAEYYNYHAAAQRRVAPQQPAGRAVVVNLAVAVPADVAIELVWFVRAHWVIRVIAEGIDLIVVFFMTCMVNDPTDHTAWADMEGLLQRNGQGNMPAVAEVEALVQAYTPKLIAYLAIFYTMMTVYQGILPWIPWNSAGRGQTAGKWLLGLRVVRTDGAGPGRPPTLYQCLMRSVVKVSTWIVCSLLFFTVFFDNNRRALHDRCAETIVVHSNGIIPAHMALDPQMQANLNAALQEVVQGGNPRGRVWLQNARGRILGGG
jgi:hypothetical protein